MHKWQRSDGGGERWCSGDFKDAFWDTRMHGKPLTPDIQYMKKRHVNNFLMSELG